MRTDEPHCLGILGRGLTGRSAQAYCERYHQPYLLWDQNDVAENDRAASLAQWVARCDRFLISPGVSPHQPLYQPLIQKNCFSDIQLFCEKIPQVQLIYVTGSNGKTSLVDLLRHILKYLGHRVHALGNNENPVLRELEKVRAGDWVIIELSSAQIWWTQHLPQALCSVITSWAPNHLDWHGSLQDYRQSKLKILQWADKAFCPQELFDESLGTHVQAWPQELSSAAKNVFATLPKEVRESPSRYAAIAVLHIAETLGWDLESIIAPMRQWELLPYRAQRRDCYGITWVNDSKSTTLAATLALAQSLPQDGAKKLLIIGGVLKGQDPEIFRPLANYVDHIILIGSSMMALARVFEGQASEAGTLQQAFIEIRRMRHRPSIVLFSPGAASFDQFAHYKERGQSFWNYVENFYEVLTPAE